MTIEARFRIKREDFALDVQFSAPAAVLPHCLVRLVAAKRPCCGPLPVWNARPGATSA